MGADIDNMAILIKKLKHTTGRCLLKSGFVLKMSGNQAKFIQTGV